MVMTKDLNKNIGSEPKFDSVYIAGNASWAKRNLNPLIALL